MKFKIAAISALFLIFSSVTYAQQIPTKFIQNGAVTAAKLSSGAAANKTVATADGAGNVSYSALPSFAQETPSGTINGSNTAFTLAHTPVSSTSVVVWLDGVLLLQGVDYTISGSSITATGIVPATGQSLRAYYSYY